MKLLQKQALCVYYAMKSVFRSRCADLMSNFVYTKREKDSRELESNDSLKRERKRAFHRRLESLERNQDEFDQFVDALSWEIEQIHWRLGELEKIIHVNEAHLEPIDKQMVDSCTQCEAIVKRVDEWVRI